jgi:hypothetical protein
VLAEQDPGNGPIMPCEFQTLFFLGDKRNRFLTNLPSFFIVQENPVSMRCNKRNCPLFADIYATRRHKALG